MNPNDQGWLVIIVVGVALWAFLRLRSRGR